MRKLITSLILTLYVACAGATVHVNDGGTWRHAWGVYVNDGGTWRLIREIYVNDNGTWRLVHSILQVNVSGNAIGSCGAFGGSCAANTSTVTCSATNNVGAVSFSWSYVSGASATIGTPNNATTAFTRAAPVGTVQTGTFRCTGTDAATGLTATADISVITTHQDLN